MKVISRPDVSAWSFKCTCDYCDAVLEIEEQDLTNYTSDQRDGDFYSCTCAVCNGRITISATIVPKLVKIRAREKANLKYMSDNVNSHDR